MMEDHDDLKMMKDPMRWPNLYLPIKRSVKDNRPDIGILNGSGPTIYLINLWDDKWAGKQWSDMPQKEYENFEALIADGWVVD
jgi:hypothetical protein